MANISKIKINTVNYDIATKDNTFIMTLDTTYKELSDAILENKNIYMNYDGVYFPVECTGILQNLEDNYCAISLISGSGAVGSLYAIADTVTVEQLLNMPISELQIGSCSSDGGIRVRINKNTTVKDLYIITHYINPNPNAVISIGNEDLPCTIILTSDSITVEVVGGTIVYKHLVDHSAEDYVDPEIDTRKFLDIAEKVEFIITQDTTLSEIHEIITSGTSYKYSYSDENSSAGHIKTSSITLSRAGDMYSAIIGNKLYYYPYSVTPDMMDNVHLSNFRELDLSEMASKDYVDSVLTITTSTTYIDIINHIDKSGSKFEFDDFIISIPNRSDWILRGQVRVEYYIDFNDPNKYCFTFCHNKYTFTTHPVQSGATVDFSSDTLYGVYGLSAFGLDTAINVNDIGPYLHAGNTLYIRQQYQGHNGLMFIVMSDTGSSTGNPDIRGLWLDRSDPTMAGVIHLVGGTTVGDSTLSLFNNASTISTLSLNDAEPLTVNKYFEMMGYDDTQA